MTAAMANGNWDPGSYKVYFVFMLVIILMHRLLRVQNVYVCYITGLNMTEACNF
jgi:hypothetical protein